MLFYWLRAPWRYVFQGMFQDAIKLMLHKPSLSSFPRKLMAIGVGIFCGPFLLSERRAVSPNTWQQFRRLPRHGPMAQCTVPAMEDATRGVEG